MDLNSYLDAAKAALGTSSDRQLSYRLGVSGPTVSLYRRGHKRPDDSTMIALADLAGIDPAHALLDLNTWRAKSPEVKAVYSSMLAKVSAAVFACVLLFPSGGNATATTCIAKLHIYTLCDIARRLTRWILTVCQSRLIHPARVAGARRKGGSAFLQIFATPFLPENSAVRCGRITALALQQQIYPAASNTLRPVA